MMKDITWLAHHASFADFDQLTSRAVIATASMGTYLAVGGFNTVQEKARNRGILCAAQHSLTMDDPGAQVRFAHSAAGDNPVMVTASTSLLSARGVEPVLAQMTEFCRIYGDSFGSCMVALPLFADFQRPPNDNVRLLLDNIRWDTAQQWTFCNHWLPKDNKWTIGPQTWPELGQHTVHGILSPTECYFRKDIHELAFDWDQVERLRVGDLFQHGEEDTLLADLKRLKQELAATIVSVGSIMNRLTSDDI